MNENLQDWMRPGKASHGGFLGKEETLEEVLKADDEAVRKLGLTHQQIADRIEYFIIAVQYPTNSGKVVDGNFNVTGISCRGWQDCPWGDRIIQYGSMDFTVENLRTREKLSFPGLIVHLIRDHHFYEGKQSPYRVDPEKAARVLEIR